MITAYVLARGRIARLRAEERMRSGSVAVVRLAARSTSRWLSSVGCTKLVRSTKTGRTSHRRRRFELAEEKRQAEGDAAWRLCFREHGFGEGSAAGCR